MKSKALLSKASKAELRDLCRVRDAEHVAILEEIAANGSTDAVRVAAVALLMDRGHGKPALSVTGEGGAGPVIFRIVTGVPRPEPPCIEHEDEGAGEL